MDMSPTPQPFSRVNAKLLAAVFIGAGLFMQPAPAEAFGGGGGGGAPASVPSCPANTTKNSCLTQSHCWWKSSTNQCKKKKSSELNQNGDLYAEGRLLAKTGEYVQAIAVLNRADQSDPHVLNYLGYSYRKSGDLTTAIRYYKAALTIDPDFVLAREYLGEGYVKAGRLDLAKLELEQIGKRCGKGCKEYVELAMVIDKGVDASW
jgi:uncharacterized protein HemY